MLDVWPENYPLNSLSASQRTAMFQTSQSGVSQSAVKESCVEVMTRQNQCSSLGVFSKPINMTTNELMREWQYFLKRRLIEGALQKRRNAVCSEIERTWFLQGVTLELQDRGLMMWWLVKSELFKDAFSQHRKVNLKKRKRCICFGSIFPWYILVFSFIGYSYPRIKKKSKLYQGQDRTTASILRARITANDITKKLNCLGSFVV